MDALDALLNRVSAPRLMAPAPDAAQRELLFRAALRAPDHGQLKPWRFLTVEGEALVQLGELFARALPADASPEALTKARAMPLRAPLLVVVIARVQASPKVPEQEQVLAAGCAAHGILLAAHAQGIGAVWRTGDMAYNPQVAAGLADIRGGVTAFEEKINRGSTTFTTQDSIGLAASTTRCSAITVAGSATGTITCTLRGNPVVLGKVVTLTRSSAGAFACSVTGTLLPKYAPTGCTTP